jgi:hypothetical protein
MPFSWVRLSSHTSRKIRECMGDSRSNVRFEECVGTIVADAGGRLEQLWLEQNGKFAHAHIRWETPDQKARIVYDLEADQVIDLVSPAEIDELADPRYSAG